MDIATNLMVGESVIHKEKEILSAIRENQFPQAWNWFAITTTYEKDNLFYILSGQEYRHPMYHREDQSLRLLGISGSKAEAVRLIRDLIQTFVDTDSLDTIKESLTQW